MINRSDVVADVADVFGLLSDPGRLRLLLALRGGELNVGTLAERAELSESATSHALRLLRAHQVVAVRRDGRQAFYRLADAHVVALIDTAVAHADHTELSHPELGHPQLGHPELGRADDSTIEPVVAH